jgi:ribose 5-phosphate isomerase B
VAIGADHGGFGLKAKLVSLLQAKGLEVADLGTHSPEPCDYPHIGYKVASAIGEGKFDRGILLCKSGIGIAIAANKVPGIRAAVCGDTSDAERSRSHNDANILVMGAEKLSDTQARRIVETWLSTPFESGGRHERRVRQLAAIERSILQQRASESLGRFEKAKKAQRAQKA